MSSTWLIMASFPLCCTPFTPPLCARWTPCVHVHAAVAYILPSISFFEVQLWKYAWL